MPPREDGHPAPPAAAAPATYEPEKLRLPAGAVRYLLDLALRTQLGEAWWAGFVTAHGDPTWVTARQWAFRTHDAEVVRAGGPGGGPGAPEE